MKTSLNNIAQIEDYLMRRMSEEEATLFNAKLHLDPGLRQQVYWQQKTYAEIKLYGRRRLLKEINSVHDQLFLQSKYSGFRKKVMSYFSL